MTTNENIELVDTVYGNDESEESYNQALALVDQYPDLEVIMAPTTVGIAAAAKAMQDEGLLRGHEGGRARPPAEMLEFTESGCAPEFALWSFVDLGYLTYYVTYGIATGQIDAAEGATFNAGRMGTYTIEADPTARCRPAGADGPVLRLQRRQHRREPALRRPRRPLPRKRRHHDGRCGGDGHHRRRLTQRVATIGVFRADGVSPADTPQKHSDSSKHSMGTSDGHRHRSVATEEERW